ncbi:MULTISPECIES: MarR family winged helix-turn-helix transcriptional regulator [unclassified Fusibacter]|uniref:MarR family winged helix-turn-helix transcriptional regulator n=1 Tax=unclassified Fusibacter TaxID=2624464 RepID=UPI0010121EE5|nr:MULTISPECIES: MarR family transcriptional regulator [unclassified Fusibacter]MCK8059426.1 MarR family transcriptional regulator [Fusibacter sp. A2]NPE21110.1 MarR family transcriptional regulator [Fusibacter sp. A1]RXV62380.1 MarR family transcriptional regulator [Fusibacter sp. A1]
MQRDYSEFVSYYVQNLSKMLTYRHNAMLEEIGLTYSQFRILCSLWGSEEKTQNEILKDLLIKPATLTGLLVTLEKKGLIVRHRGENDGRSKYVHLTEKGMALHKASFDILDTLDKQISDGIKDPCRDRMIACLSDLLAYTNELDLPELPASAQAIKDDLERNTTKTK